MHVYMILANDAWRALLQSGVAGSLCCLPNAAPTLAAAEVVSCAAQ